MKGKIKLLSLLMALAMVASLFVACDEGGTPADDDDSSGDKPAETVQLTYYAWGAAPTQPEAGVKALNEKSAKDIGVTVDFQWQGTEQEKTNAALSTGDSIDVTFICSWWGSYLSSAQNGYLADLKDEIKKYDDLMALVPQWAWDAATVNGGIYMVPTMKDTAAQQFWMVNKDYVLDQAGAQAEFDAVGKTVASVTPLLRKVKAYADAGHPYMNNLTAPFNYNKAGLNGYESGFDPVQGDVHIGDKLDDGKVEIISFYTDPDMVADYKELATWYKDGLVNQDCAQTKDEPKNIIVGTAQGWPGAEISNWGKDKNYDVSIMKKNDPVATRSAILGSGLGVFKNSKYFEKAVEYIAYTNTNTEYRDMLLYGAPGVDFEYTNDGKSVKTLTDTWAQSAFAQGATWILTPTEDVPATMYQDIKEMCMNADTTPLLQFTFDETPVANEVAAVKAIISEYSEGLQCGTFADVDATIAEMLEKCNKAGYQTIIDEANKQVKAANIA